MASVGADSLLSADDAAPPNDPQLASQTNLNRVRKDLYKVRRKAVELQVPFLTTVEEGQAVLLCVKSPLKTLS